MRIHYLEIGAYDLRKSKYFYKTHPKDEICFYLFEPNPLSIPNIIASIEIFSKDKKINIKLIKKAVSTKNEKREFFLGIRRQSSATLFKGKGYVDYNKSVIVQCINLDKWIRKTFSKKDYIYMNMDIEGAEYEVLPHMIKKGSIKYINEIEIEFHAHKFKANTHFKKIHEELKEFFNTYDNFNTKKLESL